MLELPSKASNPPQSLSRTEQLKPSVPLMAEQEPKPEPKEVEENLEPPLIYKTWILKVSIHCEACKRKVKRVLKDIEGVYETDIDLKQQKVVVKGNVESETLIKKLLKTGKHAELWPEKGKSKGKSKKKEKHSDSESSGESSGHEDEKEKVKFEVQDPTKNGDPTGKIIDGGGDSQAKQAGTAPTGDGQTVGGAGKKKKKKKKKKSGGGGGGNASGEAPGDPPANGAPPSEPNPGHSDTGPQPMAGPVQVPIVVNESPTRHYVTQYQPHYIPHPVYSVRYSTAYAMSSQPRRESYYATPQQYSYAYVHPGVRPEIDSPPSDYEPYSSQPSDSLEIFSDENPNGCSIV
ncbi:heavy metal-associated isoprenylated plant protein 36 [Cucumis melo var. makuwa]|uniref:Heavy metal-associated isoprenylated plant protein 36 n=2 Tax=Cucumis melo TaxID=3656 RepID=A0A5A7U1B6_CUCMM|nr:heavy metal-associated isoprenylated plant protein 36 [Cucumis melo]KAA0048026.1 heavy metal-associated isoprenylated plant protein 36 [Cucumis melo var. makuwa]